MRVCGGWRLGPLLSGVALLLVGCGGDRSGFGDPWGNLMTGMPDQWSAEAVVSFLEPPSQQPRSAGTVTVTGTKMPLEFPYFAEGYPVYRGVTPNGADLMYLKYIRSGLFDGGETITVH